MNDAVVSATAESKLGAVLNADDDVAAKIDNATGNNHGGKIDAGTGNKANGAANEEGPRLLEPGGNGKLPAPNRGGKVDAGAGNNATGVANEAGPRQLGLGGNGELLVPVAAGVNEASTNIDKLLFLSLAEGSLLF
jgi:hypothetical protein